MAEWKDLLSVMNSFLNILVIPALLILYNIKAQLVKLTTTMGHLNEKTVNHDERITFIERRHSDL